MQCKKLSDHDRLVLNAILNPLELGGNAAGEETNLDDFDTPENLVDDPEEESLSLTESLRLESEAVSLAETGNLKEALNQLQAALDLTPKRASLFNNRAQVHRLTGNDNCKYIF